jgi:beta-fructofuranosidase
MATPATWSQVVPSLNLDNQISGCDGGAASFDPIKSPGGSIDVAVKVASTTARLEVQARVEKDFDRWRPRFHLMPRRNWANDPCGPCYSASDGGFYHMAFQWNPEGWVWGNISWGYALSRDLVHWKVSPWPSIQPSQDEDPHGVFTGCTWPTNPQGSADDTITSFYTSAQGSPIHWTLPYQKDSELVRMATSDDRGRTWKRHHARALVPGPPEGVDVTGWRDPFIGPWDSVDKCLGRRVGDYMYGILAGGVRHSSPAVFLYSIDAHDLTRWSFLCVPLAPGTNFAPSPSLPDFGTNWEVTNFMTLQDQSKLSYDVLVMSVEGIRPDSKRVFPGARGKRDRPTKLRRINRAQNWLCAQVKKQSCTQGTNEQPVVALEFKFGGCLDWGCFYAGNSFRDPVTEKQIVYGWITEEDLPPSLTAKQEWSGLLSLPRVLGMTRIADVVASSHSKIESLDWIHWSRSPDGTYAVTTLTSTPDPRLSVLRHNEKNLVDGSAPLGLYLDTESPIDSTDLLKFDTKSIEVQASFSFVNEMEQIGLELYFSPGKPTPKRLLHTGWKANFYRPTEQGCPLFRSTRGAGGD